MDRLPAWMRITFKGRINRFRYIWYPMGIGLVIGLPNLIFVGMYGIKAVATGNIPPILSLIYAVIQFVGLLYYISFGVRRLKDLNKSKWLFLVTFVPIANFVLFIYLLFFKGTTGSNKYGPDPLEYDEYSEYLEAVNSHTPDAGNRFER
jgi:Predicted membrane protein